MPSSSGSTPGLTLTLLMWTIWRTPTNASKWRMGFNSSFKGLIRTSPREVCGGQSGTGSGFSSCTSVFSFFFPSTSAPYC